MPQTRFSVSPWLEAVPIKKRPAFPAFRGTITAPLVIVGGGMTGAMTAYACAAAGLKVIVLEANRIGQGGTARASGMFSSEACESLRDLDARAGRRTARALFAHTRLAPRELAATVKRLGIKADLRLLDALRIVPAGGNDKALRLEAADRVAARLDASWLLPAAIGRQAGAAAAGGVRLRDWGVCDPYRLTLGFMAAAIKRGAKVFERSPVTRIRFDRRRATLALENGSIVTEAAVVCTGEPTDLFKALRRHFRFEERYVVATEPLPAAVRAEVGPRAAIVCDADRPAHQLWWTSDHRAVFSGANQRRPAARLVEQTLVQRTGQLMYELSRLYPAISGAAPAFGWGTPLAHSVDDVLCAGTHRNFPHQHLAFGTLHDPVRAFLASRLLVRSVLGALTAEDEPFSFSRNL